MKRLLLLSGEFRTPFVQQDGRLSPEWQRRLRDVYVFDAAPLPVHATNAAAVAGGMKPGEFYRTGGDPDVVCVVH